MPKIFKAPIALVLLVFFLDTNTTALAQVEAVGIFADTGGNACEINDNSAGVLSIHVVHIGTSGATASEFAAPQPACMTGATHLSDQTQFPVAVGDSQNGVAVAYGNCLSGPIHVMTVQYFASGLSEACCGYPLLPSPRVGQIEAVDCSSTSSVPKGHSGVLNANGNCSCGGGPVEESTWGNVKSLYD